MIRKATIEDVDQLTDLFDKYLVFYRMPSNHEKHKSYLKERIENNEAIIFLVFDDENKAVGFALIYTTFSSLLLSKILILNDLYVNSTVRNNSFGEQLNRQVNEFDSNLIRLRTAKL